MTSAEIVPLLKKQPIGVGCAVLCIIIGALIYFRTDKIAESQALYDAKSAEAAKIVSNVGISKNLQEQVTEIQGFTKEMESRLVRAGQLAVNLQYFYKLEAENEVKLVDVRQNTPPRSPKLYVGIPYAVNVQGSYKQVMQFLQKVETGRHFSRINSAVFNKSIGTDDMNLTLSLDLLGQP